MLKQFYFNQFSLASVRSLVLIEQFDRTLSAATTLGPSGPGRDGNEGILRIHQSSSNAGKSLSDWMGVLPLCREALRPDNSQLEVDIDSTLWKILDFTYDISVDSYSFMGCYLPLKKSTMNKTYGILMEKQGRTQKKRSSIDSYTWICRPLSALCRPKM